MSTTTKKGTPMDRIVEQLLQVKSDPQVEWIRTLQQEVRQVVSSFAEEWICRQLEAVVDRWLGREAYERCDPKSGRRLPVDCPQCHSSYQRDLVRNGHRRRQLLTTYGNLTIWLPRVKCRCGGSVRIPFELIQRHQRVWRDVDLRLQGWAALALSLREMQGCLVSSLSTSIGLRTVNERVNQVPKVIGKQRPLSTVPPVVALDAIWITQLEDQETSRQDALGRERLVKRKKRKTVLIALGIWPRTGRCHVLDWELAAGESQQDWAKLLSRLNQRQLWKERGLRMFLHDGGLGLKAALRRIYWEVPSQRCIFHKLRNVYRAIVVPEEMSRSQARALKKKIIEQAAQVFRAPTRDQAVTLLVEFKAQWQEQQPEAVATLLRDKEDTLRFYALLEQEQDWQPKAIRTTSSLERINRALRKHFRAAGAYHSEEGLLAAVHRVLIKRLIL
jgi:transposase-like protein